MTSDFRYGAPPSDDRSAISEYEDGVLRPVALAAQAWDLHVDACPLCLVSGNDLCYEGQYLHDDVVEVRLRATPTGPSSIVDTVRPLSSVRRRSTARVAAA